MGKPVFRRKNYSEILEWKDNRSDMMRYPQTSYRGEVGKIQRTFTFRHARLSPVEAQADDYGLFYVQKNVHHKCYHLIKRRNMVGKTEVRYEC